MASTARHLRRFHLGFATCASVEVGIVIPHEPRKPKAVRANLLVRPSVSEHVQGKNPAAFSINLAVDEDQKSQMCSGLPHVATLRSRQNWDVLRRGDCISSRRFEPRSQDNQDILRHYPDSTEQHDRGAGKGDD